MISERDSSASLSFDPRPPQVIPKRRKDLKSGCCFFLIGTVIVIPWSLSLNCMVGANYTLTNANFTMPSQCRNATVYNADPQIISFYSSLITIIAVFWYGLMFRACLGV
jgi:hypothetical protein